MSLPDNRRTLSLTLGEESTRIKGFVSHRPVIRDLVPGDAGPCTLTLQLTLTERAAYRFNLTSDHPRLFVRCGDAGQAAVPSAITASQDVAASWMDGEQQVLDVAMPVAIQAWIEGYLARHGEAPEEGRKKKRKGAGRARELAP
ncbi:MULTISPECIES: DUF3305 domain-containing protein [unclassified Halomonas]|uniref:DUF3305 domain-containing protein n=1 Tax=unclassified Halomonas TaxID=2609666 RepID=UPI0003B8FD09|nr:MULTISPECIES: DUF3305 domain-containing protein [unclassified Halomonas]ERS90010.1 hypothetical protein Q671_05570 [Halomonas sp. PBN3]